MSTTTVPILPLEKGAMLKLWGGVGLAALVAAGLAWFGTADAVGGGCGSKAFVAAAKDGALDPIKTESGLRFQTVKAGKGPKPTDGEVAVINYSGSLATTGEVFDANKGVPLPVSGSIPGFSEGLKLMQPGGSYRLCIPGKLGYGPKGTPDGRIPANATLLFEVDLVGTMTMQQAMEMMRAQQAQQGQQPGGPPPGR